MFILILKIEKRETTSLRFVGVYASKEWAEQNVDAAFGPLKPADAEDVRMVSASGTLPPKAVYATERMQESMHVNPASYVLAEYGG